MDIFERLHGIKRGQRGYAPYQMVKDYVWSILDLCDPECIESECERVFEGIECDFMRKGYFIAGLDFADDAVWTGDDITTAMEEYIKWKVDSGTQRVGEFVDDAHSWSVAAG